MKNPAFTVAGVCITAMFLGMFYATDFHGPAWALLGILAGIGTLVGSF